MPKIALIETKIARGDIIFPCTVEMEKNEFQWLEMLTTKSFYNFRVAKN